MQVTDQETLRRIAYNLRKFRGDRSYREIAELAKTHPGNIQQIETEQRMPQAGTLTRIAEGLGVGVNELLMPVPDDPSQKKPESLVDVA